MELKNLPKKRLQELRKSPITNMISKEDGKFSDMKDYTDNEISEMYNGIYKHSKKLLVDGDYFINVNDITETLCILGTVTYYKKPSIKDYKSNNHNVITNVRTFYIKDYFLITKDEVYKTKRHKITRFLNKVGAIKSGRGEFRNLHSIRNDYATLKGATGNLYPKDLYHPIKMINRLFFGNQYYLSEFKVESDITFEKA